MSIAERFHEGWRSGDGWAHDTSTAMAVVCTVAAVLLVSAAALTAYRVLAGPSTLDRVVGIDSLVAITASGLAVWAAFSDDTTVLPGIVALALVGFLGSAAVSRFRVRDDR